MFETLRPQPDDQILMLMGRFHDDPRSDKIDLGVGVFRDSLGRTPVMRAVKAAERRLWDTQQTKGYTQLIGDPVFIDAMRELVLGEAVDVGRIAGAATVGGTGAIRQGLELIRLARPGVRVHIPDPSWPNHQSILGAMGIDWQPYRYFDAAANALDLAGMLSDLRRVAPGDVVLLHGCCHNPTGVDPTLAEWRHILAALEQSGATVLVDLAYQGFGDGLDEDAAATGLLAQTLREVVIAVSCSKNFGLYRDRAGAVLVVGASARDRDVIKGNLSALNRQAYSFPADHGASVAAMVLNDADLRADWTAELADMRSRVNLLRRDLAAALQQESQSDRYSFLAVQRGMFSRLGVTPDQVSALQRDHAVYMVGDGRMNVAGLSQADIPRLAEAIVAVCGVD
tara:strand:+ start:3292 stop:4482 length:1191 start_codon:yes stop_codon:yes gene_type:complete